MMAIPEQNNRSATILVVDDDLASLWIIVDYLQERGFRVVISRDGKTGKNRNFPRRGFHSFGNKMI